VEEREPNSLFQTKRVIRTLLESVGASPKKRFGQCFLIDRNLMDKLVDSAELRPTDVVLEVGGGTGSLTAILAARCGRVVSVEIDREVASVARESLAEFANIVLLEEDALESKSSLNPIVVRQLELARGAISGELKLVANLPYDIATPLVVNLLVSDLPITRLCFTVQAEVADRFLAVTGTHDYGPVSILTQLLATGRRICKLPPQAFWPAPKVHSAMLRLDVHPQADWNRLEVAVFAAFVHRFFQFRRKTIAHIAKMLELSEPVLAALTGLGVSPTARPENISPQQWLSLFRACQ